ncbi:MAG TPA: hypothetical protein VGF71_12795 [Caulobacteraceae bacterium]|jgi:hypothetical protein
MDRQRSPSYPSLALEQAIDMVAKIHKANRTNVISRETAAKDMGYAGLTGRSLTVIGSLAQYGLIEKAGKGDIKVTRRAVEILHPVEEAHRSEAIVEAALAPALFRDLRERFPEGVPSENALRSFMVQNDFNDVAIGPAISAFLETNAFAEKAKESGRTGPDRAEAGESPSQTPPKEDQVMEAANAAPPRFQPAWAPSASDADLNKPVMNIRGGQVMISGLFDLKGLRQLKKRITGLEALMAPDEDDEDTGSAEVG